MPANKICFKAVAVAIFLIPTAVFAAGVDENLPLGCQYVPDKDRISHPIDCTIEGKIYAFDRSYEKQKKLFFFKNSSCWEVIFAAGSRKWRGEDAYTPPVYRACMGVEETTDFKWTLEIIYFGGQTLRVRNLNKAKCLDYLAQDIYAVEYNGTYCPSEGRSAYGSCNPASAVRKAACIQFQGDLELSGKNVIDVR